MNRANLPVPMTVLASMMAAALLASGCGGGGGTGGGNNGGGGTGGGNNGGGNYTGKTKCKASNVSFRNGLYDDTYIVKASMPNSSKPIDPNDPNILETCGFGSVCYIDDYKGVGHKPRNDGKAFCARSVLDKKSPYYNFGADLGFTEFMRYPTKLEIDCRKRNFSVIGSQANGGKGSRPADPNNTDPAKGGHPAGAIMNCSNADRLDVYKWPVAYGKGPVFSDFNKGSHTWYGAEFDPDKREIYSVVKWGNSQHVKTATIVAWNVDTKDRRIVSGIYPNSTTGDETFGSGYESPIRFHAPADGDQPMTAVDTIRLAEDGKLYASSEHEIIRVDPDTGKRDLVWKKQVEKKTGIISGKYGQCIRPSYLGVKDGLQLEINSFAVGPDGKFYKGFRDVRGGNGVLMLSKDAKTCTVIARWNGKGDKDPSDTNTVPAPADVGTGFLPPNINSQVRGMMVHDGKLYMTIAKAFVSIDLDTLKRVRVDDPKVLQTTGYTSMYYDPNRKVIWTSGTVSSNFGNTIVDPVTGQQEVIGSDNVSRQQYPGKEILKTVYPAPRSTLDLAATSMYNITNMGGVIVDPKDPDIAYGVTNLGGLLKLELSTLNNYIHSWGQH